MALEENIGKLHKIAEENNQELIGYESFRASLLRSIDNEADIDQMVMKMIEASNGRSVGTYKNGVFVFSPEVLKIAETLVYEENKNVPGTAAYIKEQANKNKGDTQENVNKAFEIPPIMSEEDFDKLSDSEKEKLFGDLYNALTKIENDENASPERRATAKFGKKYMEASKFVEHYDEELMKAIQQGSEAVNKFIEAHKEDYAFLLAEAIENGKLSTLEASKEKFDLIRALFPDKKDEEIERILVECDGNIVNFISAVQDEFCKRNGIEIKEVVEGEKDPIPEEPVEDSVVETDEVVSEHNESGMPSASDEPVHDNVVLLGKQVYEGVDDPGYQQVFVDYNNGRVVSHTGASYPKVSSWAHGKDVMDVKQVFDSTEEILGGYETEIYHIHGLTEAMVFNWNRQQSNSLATFTRTADPSATFKQYDPNAADVPRNEYDNDGKITHPQVRWDSEVVWEDPSVVHEMQHAAYEVINKKENAGPVARAKIPEEYIHNRGKIPTGGYKANEGEDMKYTEDASLMPHEAERRPISDDEMKRVTNLETLHVASFEAFHAASTIASTEMPGYDKNPEVIPQPKVSAEKMTGPNDPVVTPPVVENPGAAPKVVTEEERKANEVNANASEPAPKYEVNPPEPEQVPQPEETSLAKITWATKLRRGLNQIVDRAKNFVNKIVSAVTGNSDNNASANNSSTTTSSTAGQGKEGQSVDYLNQHFDINVRAAQEATRAAQEAKAQNPKGQSDKDVEME